MPRVRIFFSICLVLLVVRVGFVVYERAVWKETHRMGGVFEGRGVVTKLMKGSRFVAQIDGGQGIVVGVKGEMRAEEGDFVKVSGVVEPCMSERADAAGCVANAHVAIEKKGASFVRAWCSRLSENIKSRVRMSLPFPHSEVAIGMLIGDVSGMPKETSEAFRRTGLSHIMALSGYNIVLVITFVGNLLVWLPRRPADILTLVFVVAFVLLTGAQASLVRAGIMGVLGVVARLIGRPRATTRALWIAAYVMCLYEPLVVVYDIGFQLSFAATYGLIAYSSRIEKKLSWVTERLELRSNFASTLAATLLTTLIIFWHFQTLSPLSPITNIVVAPIVPFVMGASFLAFVGGMWLGPPLVILSSIFLWLVEWMSHLPFVYIS